MSFFDKLLKQSLINFWKNPNDHQLGFIIFHFGTDGNYLLICNWHDANMIRHKVFTFSKLDESKVFIHDDSNLMACIWEIQLIQIEKESWIHNILKSESSLISTGISEKYLNDLHSGKI